jgi:hypothetical protein
MKKSDIKQIIREEVIQLIKEQYLTEAFGDPLLAKINKLGGLDRNWRKGFWDSAAKTYDLAWDKLPKGTLRKYAPESGIATKDGIMTFWVVKTEKPNPYQTGYMTSYNIRPGVLAVTLGGKIQYYNRGGIGPKGSGSSASSVVGKGERGQLMVKKLKELADEIYIFDLGQFRGGTTALKAKRADLKLGKDTFTDHKAWKRANLDRYKDILNARVGSRDQVDKMVADIVKIANEAVKTGMEVVKMGKYDRMMTTVSGNEVELEVVANSMTRTLRLYARYIRYANDADKEKDQGYGGNYYDKSMKQTAGDIKRIHVAFKQGNASNIQRY